MDNLKIFNNDGFGKVRTVIIHGEPWFIAKDIANALGYANPQKAIRSHCKHSILVGVNKMDALARLINEKDVYRLIMRSKLPSSEKFQDWVMDEVLPIIIKTGGYVQKLKDEFGLIK